MLCLLVQQSDGSFLIIHPALKLRNLLLYSRLFTKGKIFTEWPILTFQREKNFTYHHEHLE